MKQTDWIGDIQGTFLDDSKPAWSILHFLTLILILWNINPESIYYNWLIWAVLSGCWAGLAMVLGGKKLLSMIFRQRLWLIGVWPAYTLLLWIIGRGLIHRKFLAIAFMIAVPFYYLKFGMRREMAVISKIGAVYLGAISFTTILQMATIPDIARVLAAGRGTGNFRASALLGNFHSVYDSILIAVLLGGVIWLEKPDLKKKWGWALLLTLHIALILLAQYDIAIIVLMGGCLLLVIHFRSRRRFPPMSDPSAGSALLGETLITSFIYLLPAMAILVFKDTMYYFIDLMDRQQLLISEKLFDRIWVYLRSLYLYLEYPLTGYGMEPDPAGFMVGQHSDYLDLLAEYGFLGFLIFLLTWSALLIMIRGELKPSHRSLYWVAVIIFHIIFMVNPILEVSSVIIMLFILPGISICFEGLCTLKLRE